MSVRRILFGVYVGTCLLAFILLCMSACASTGFYNMSDAWCDSHPNASEYRCP